MDNNKIVFKDEEGNDKEFELLFTFNSDKTGKSYAVLGILDENEELDIIAASYDTTEDGEIGELYPIEDDEEWAMVEETIDAFFEEDDEYGAE